MNVTLSVTLLTAGAVYVLCKYANLKFWHAAVCIFCGFYLASSSLAPFIHEFTYSLFRVL